MLTLEEFREGIKTAVPGKDCPVAKTLELLGGKWTSKVIFELQRRDAVRFGELKRSLADTTNTMLSSTLKRLEEAGIVERRQYEEMPVRVEYSLTEAGREMLPVFYEMAKWGSRYFGIELE